MDQKPVFLIGGELLPFAPERGEEIQHCCMTLSPTGRGKSFLLEQLAKDQGITLEELEAQLAPSEEELAREAQRRECERKKEEARHFAVIDAFWAHSDPEDHEFYNLHDYLSLFLNIKEPQEQHILWLIKQLPKDVVYEGFKWGFCDTGVRDDCCEYIEVNKASLIVKLEQTKF
ncbi:hypothetical protein [Neptuniibacter sp. QD37_11]|uniref:hypothetical protein n=1 Tax=Neptuniibacter sp. QD37_11 TaxID=3398209 RepID=UPI0039F4B2EE